MVAEQGAADSQRMTRGQAARDKADEAQDFLDQFLSDPDSIASVSVCIDMEDCVFPVTAAEKAADPSLKLIDEDAVTGIEEMFLSEPGLTEDVDPLLTLMQLNEEEEVQEDGSFKTAVTNLLAGYADCDAAMGMDPIDDVSDCD